jgi:hypothetical protein
MLMKRFHGDIKREVGIEQELYSVNEDSIQPFYSMMVMNILKDAKENPSGSEQMKVVAGVLKKYIELRSLVRS